MTSEIFVGAYCRDMRTALTISIDNRSTQLFLSIGYPHTSPLDNQDLFSLSERTVYVSGGVKTDENRQSEILENHGTDSAIRPVFEPINAQLWPFPRRMEEGFS